MSPDELGRELRIAAVKLFELGRMAISLYFTSE
jgi:hypothetical protein